ncbi:MAG: transporter substrate-binding domain-containing protein [Puniceicoccaceae bacterium]
MKIHIPLTLALLISPLATADEAADETILRIGIKETPPLTIRNDNGTWAGPTVWLVERIAEGLGFETRYEEVELTEIFGKLESGGLDIGAAALSITSDREEVIDFTHSYFEGGIGIAARSDEREMWLLALGNIFSFAFLQALMSLLVLLAGIGLLMWLAERRINREQFGGRPVAGIGNGLWWSAVTMTTVGYGDKAPKTFAGRVLGLVWMFSAVIITAGFTAGFASSLTRESIRSKVEGPADLAKVRTATMAGSTSAAWLRQMKIPFETGKSVRSLLWSLSEGKVEAVVFDKPVLEYYVSQGGLKNVQVLDGIYSRENYGLALPQGSALLEPADILLLKLVESDEWRQELIDVLTTRLE